jgi:hypothetical protein
MISVIFWLAKISLMLGAGFVLLVIALKLTGAVLKVMVDILHHIITAILSVLNFVIK